MVILLAVAEMGEDERGLGEFLDDVFHLLQLSVDIQDHALFDDLLDEQVKFFDGILVRNCVVAKLADPNKTELLTTLFNFAQGFVHVKGVDHASAQETALVLFHITGDFAVPGGEFGRCPFELAALRIDDTTLYPGTVEIVDKLLKISGDRMPLPEFPAFGRAMQMSIENEVGFRVRRLASGLSCLARTAGPRRPFSLER